MENKEGTAKACLTPSHAGKIKFLLEKLDSLNTTDKRKYFSRINKEEADYLSEVFVNILQECMPISYVQVKQLYRHRGTVRKLADNNITLKQKRKFFQSIPAIYILRVITSKAAEYLTSWRNTIWFLKLTMT